MELTNKHDKRCLEFKQCPKANLVSPSIKHAKAGSSSNLGVSEKCLTLTGHFFEDQHWIVGSYLLCGSIYSLFGFEFRVL